MPLLKRIRARGTKTILKKNDKIGEPVYFFLTMKPYDPSMDPALKRLVRELFPRGIPYPQPSSRSETSLASSTVADDKIIQFPPAICQWIHDKVVLGATGGGGNIYFETSDQVIADVPGTHRLTVKQRDKSAVLTITANDSGDMLIGRIFTVMVKGVEKERFEFSRRFGAIMAVVVLPRFSDLNNDSPIQIQERKGD
jgi:hypothetical protein